jgi:hypothetical protein
VNLKFTLAIRALCLLLVLLANRALAEPELICPCSIDSNGSTSMVVSAGVNNPDAGSSTGSLRLRVIAHPTPSFYDSSFYLAGYVYLPGPLGPNQQIAHTGFETGFNPPPDGNYHYTLQLQNYGVINGQGTLGWYTADFNRMRQRARSVPEAGYSGYFGNPAIEAAFFLSGEVLATLYGAQI